MYCISDLDLVDKCIGVERETTKDHGISQKLCIKSRSINKPKKRKKKNGTEATTTFESLVNLALKSKYKDKHNS